METFNEVITLLVLYLLMCFSDFVYDPTMRNECGKAFIAIVILYALVHLTLLFKDVIAKLILSCRKRLIRCKKSKKKSEKNEDKNKKKTKNGKAANDKAKKSPMKKKEQKMGKVNE